MKCPKCGYISFDYNTKCPKCNKDISAEQEKLNFPPFKPNPPFLLESLIGEATDSAPALHVRQSKKAGPDVEVGGMEGPVFSDKSASGEIQEIDIASFGPNESQDRELGSLELPVDSAGTDEFEQPGDEISLDLGGDQSGPSGDSSANDDQVSLNLDQASDELVGTGDTGELDFDLDDNSDRAPAKETDLKLDDFGLDEEPKAGAKKPKAAQKSKLDEIASDLDLDDEDLSIDLENLDLDLDLDASDSDK